MLFVVSSNYCSKVYISFYETQRRAATRQLEAMAPPKKIFRVQNSRD